MRISHILLASCGLCIGLIGLVSPSMAQTANSTNVDRQELDTAFDSLKQGALNALELDGAATKETTVQTKDGPSKVQIVGPCQIPPGPLLPQCPQPVQLGVKIWAQLIDQAGNEGPFVNLTKYKWSPNQRFYLWLETAVPIQMAFFQNYPEGILPSRQITPDERFPETFGTIMPGRPHRFPVLLAMDDNLINEQVSIVVVRADCNALPVNGGPVAVATATATATGNGTAVAQATAVIAANTFLPGTNPSPQTQAQANAFAGIEGPQGTLKGSVIKGTKDMFTSIQTYAEQETDEAARLKLNLIGQPPIQNASTSQNPADVSILLMGPGKIAQIELTLFK